MRISGWSSPEPERGKKRARERSTGPGTPDYILTAIDGQITGGGGTDKLGIKIWDVSSGALVYDNQVTCGDSPDGADPCTALAGGNIVIHH